MTDELPDVLRDVLGHVVAEQRREWRREREVIEAQSREAVAELRARIVELERKTDETIAAKLDGLRDGEAGAPGERGEQGSRGEPGEPGRPGEIPDAPPEIAEHITRALMLLTQAPPPADAGPAQVINIITGNERREKTITMRKDRDGNAVARVVEV